MKNLRKQIVGVVIASIVAIGTNALSANSKITSTAKKPISNRTTDDFVAPLKNIAIRGAKVIDDPNNHEISLSNQILRVRFMLEHENSYLLKYSRSWLETADLFVIKFEDEERIDDLLTFMGYELQYVQPFHIYYLLRKDRLVVFVYTGPEEDTSLLDEIVGELKKNGYSEEKVPKILNLTQEFEFEPSDLEEFLKRIEQSYKKLFDKSQTDSKIINLTKSWFINEHASAFSPDGKYVAFSGHTIHGYEIHPMPSDIYLMNSDGSDVHKLFESTARYVLPTWCGAVKAWSDDGTKIYVHGGANLEVPIQYYDLTSNKLCTITKEEINKLPRNSLSPNGKMQAFFPITKFGSRTSIGVRYIDTGKEEIVVPEDSTKKRPPETWSPAWSPDSEWIAYNYKESGHNEMIYIHVVNIKTKENRRLTKGGGPIWSPDGKYIAFCNYLSFNPDIFLYRWNSDK